ncbi:glycosyltransferase [Tamlana sp. 2201CG12-4]|uniref:glycosyltransferase family 2 protein n=1 Tax=Tamlana sp. 2201CG12-4 TaxID=3112582 RepID=UPI002DB64A08|nr:glycosyltransferase [Tamlana sp. 2201CG12-4]MEC3907603.1 glycosyltransferase [Tamlana sp. 2201CG12-4]
MNNVVLSICCTSYNHEHYIKKALDSFLMQKTTFPIEILIHDDASTDRSVEIIQDYAKKDSRIKTILQTENQYSQNKKPFGNFLFPMAQGKYIAVCDGDDYWIDPLKLQKQVDFLESNRDYVVAWTNYKMFNGIDFSENYFGFKNPYRIIDFDTIFTPYCTHTSTIVFKRSALNLNKISNFKHYKDNTLYALILESGKGVFMDFVGAVYRINEGGVYALKSDYFKNHSSYLNIKEIIELIPGANTKNMRKVRRSLGNATAFEVLKLKQNGEPVTDAQIDFMNDYFKNADLRTQLKYLKRRCLKKAPQK